MARGLPALASRAGDAEVIVKDAALRLAVDADDLGSAQSTPCAG